MDSGQVVMDLKKQGSILLPMGIDNIADHVRQYC
ncbi:hypothetical protein M2101_001407 [Parabacteroides sp. PM5-20]|nr:hypothetical protein [Parabacteroides sp. PM5-20]